MATLSHSIASLSWLLVLMHGLAHSFRVTRGSKGHNATAGLAFDKALFMATHNSYEKKPVGVVQSLDLGVRMVELDIFRHEFEKRKEYCVGHDKCFDETTQVGQLGNPNTHFMNAWLAQIRHWSVNHRDHAPITIMIDLKSDFTSGALPFRKGGLSNLQEVVQTIFGDSLYWASSKPEGYWPSVDSLRGKVIVALSGHRQSRVFYQQDEGYKPRVAVNEGGMVVEVHQDKGSSKLYYWTGKVNGGTIVWSRHGKYDSGRDASPAINDDNCVVEVHKSESRDEIWYHVGTLNKATMEMHWGPSVKYDSGKNPTVRFLGSSQVQERHKSPKTGKVWVRNGTVDRVNRRINWHSGAVQRNVPLFDHVVAQSASGSKRAEVREGGGLVYFRAGGQSSFAKIQYAQLFFIDWQPGCDGGGENYPPLNRGAFIGVSRKCSSAKVVDGVATRVWQYNLNDARSGKTSGAFPATDEPGEAFKAWTLSKPNGIAY